MNSGVIVKKRNARAVRLAARMEAAARNQSS